MKTRQLIAKLYEHYPPIIAENNEDYVGLMTGKLPTEVHKILLCLDMDQTIFMEALEYRPDLIITHHPFFYGDKQEILKTDKNKKNLNKMLNKYNIPVFSIHTNFDGGTPGMNDFLAEMLHLKDIYMPEAQEMMRIGTLSSPMKINKFVEYAKKQLHAEYGLLIQEGTDLIKKVAIIGGGGSSYFNVAQAEKADIYISCDAPHHTRREIVIAKYNYLDLPHEIERVFMPALAKMIMDIDKDIDIKIIDHEKPPKVV